MAMPSLWWLALLGDASVCPLVVPEWRPRGLSSASRGRRLVTTPAGDRRAVGISTRSRPRLLLRQRRLRTFSFCATTTLAMSTAANEQRKTTKAAEVAEREAAEWDLVLEALTYYKEEHGNLRVPTRFKVPRDEGWPEALHDMKLGTKVAAIRGSGKYVGDEDRRRTLDEMGFEWRLRRLKQLEPATYEPFEALVVALETYERLFASVTVPKNFIVPQLDDWPSQCQGLPLGSRLQTIKTYNRRNEPHPYFDPTQVPEDLIERRITELANYGVKVKRRRRPSRGPPPSSDRGDALAAWAELTENQTANDAMPVESDEASHMWDILLRAIRLFKELHGHARVPQHYVVPDAEPWPEEARNLTLGIRVSKMRLKGSYVRDRPDRRVALLDLGLDLPFLVESSSAPRAGWVETDEESRRSSITVPLTADLNDDDVLSPAEAAYYAEHGWNFDDFDGDFEFEDVVRALDEYRRRFGHCDVPEDFVITVEEEEDDEEDDVDALAALLDAPAEPTVEDLLALEADEEDAANDAVSSSSPFSFGSPEEEPWPRDLEGLRLGIIVDAFRVGDVDAWDVPERRRRLDAVGFDWGDRDRYLDGIHWHFFLTCLFSFSKIKGSLAIPWDFVVPHEEPWPLPLRGAKIGTMTNKVRQQENTLREHFPLRAQLLDSMGFIFLPPIFEKPEVRYDARLPPCLRLADSELEITREKRRKMGSRKPGSSAGGARKSANATKQAFAIPKPGDAGVDYAAFTVAQLKDILRDRNLPLSGKRKQDYVDRLVEYDTRFRLEQREEEPDPPPLPEGLQERAPLQADEQRLDEVEAVLRPQSTTTTTTLLEPQL